MCGSELHALPEGVQRVSRFLQDAGHPHAPQMLDGAARTAQEAADQLSILVGQVAKSIIFKRRSDGAAVLVEFDDGFTLRDDDALFVCGSTNSLDRYQREFEAMPAPQARA